MRANSFSDPQPAGGWGKGAVVTRSDLQLLKRALRQGWEIPEANRKRIIESLMEAMDSDQHNGRLALRAAEVVIELDRLGLINDDD
ncbi:hypothetical protein SH661x_000661 [Planctomicrobium sp. SH661]|uniref:hypothetical protein n=1 Tax=Planctomicrobium sp. SH661 TaxID=3448124 RepID=UPI003F5C4D9C